MSTCAPVVPPPGPSATSVQLSRYVQGESACKPASVPRGFPRGGGHPSGTGVAAGLLRSTRGLGRASLRGRMVRGRCVPSLTLLRVGFTEPTGHPAAGALLPHRFTLTALGRAAVCSLWHCPAGRPDWRLASTLPCGGRTFLDPGEPGPRPPSRLACTSAWFCVLVRPVGLEPLPALDLVPLPIGLRTPGAVGTTRTCTVTA